MPLGANEVNQHPKRTVCGVAVDIYSIVIPDKYDAMLNPIADDYSMGILIPVK